MQEAAEQETQGVRIRMNDLHPHIRRARIDVGLLLGEIEDAVPRSLRLNIGVQHAALVSAEREAQGDRPNRRAWSLAQAAVPVLLILFTSVTQKSSTVAPKMIERGRRSVTDLGTELTRFAEGR